MLAIHWNVASINAMRMDGWISHHWLSKYSNHCSDWGQLLFDQPFLHLFDVSVEWCWGGRWLKFIQCMATLMEAVTAEKCLVGENIICTVSCVLYWWGNICAGFYTLSDIFLLYLFFRIQKRIIYLNVNLEAHSTEENWPFSKIQAILCILAKCRLPMRKKKKMMITSTPLLHSELLFIISSFQLLFTKGLSLACCLLHLRITSSCRYPKCFIFFLPVPWVGESWNRIWINKSDLVGYYIHWSYWMWNCFERGTARNKYQLLMQTAVYSTQNRTASSRSLQRLPQWLYFLAPLQ